MINTDKAKQRIIIVLHAHTMGSQPTFTSSKSATKTPEKGVNICSKVTIKTPERLSGVVLVFLL